MDRSGIGLTTVHIILMPTQYFIYYHADQKVTVLFFIDDTNYTHYWHNNK